MRLILLLLVSISLPVASQTFTVGVVPQFDTKTLHQIWSPILNELEARTGYQFHFEGAEDIPAFEQALKQGRYDFAYMNPYHYTKAPLYTALIRDHQRQLFGVLVVEHNSPVTRLEDLQGRTLVFPAPNALGASLMMRAELSRRYQLTFVEKYVKTHTSVYLNVATGLASAGGGVQKTLSQQDKALRQRLRVLHTTQPVPPHPFSGLKTLSEETRRAVQNAFVKMSEQEFGQAILSRVPIKHAGIATDQDYQIIRDMQLDAFYVSPGS